MAVLSDTDRFDVWARYMRDKIIANATITKPELRAAVDAIDDFLDANDTAINNAIPEPARSALTKAEKAAIVMYVTAKRYDVEV